MNNVYPWLHRLLLANAKIIEQCADPVNCPICLLPAQGNADHLLWIERSKPGGIKTRPVKAMPAAGHYLYVTASGGDY